MEKKIELKVSLVDKNKLRVHFGKDYSKLCELKESETFLVGMVGVENLKPELVEKTSKKTGEIYHCVEINITDNTSKIVYLDNAEMDIINFLSI